MSGSLLAFWGESDELIDMADVHEFTQHAAASHISYEPVYYTDAGHGFLRGLSGAGAEHSAALDSWGRTLQFFHANLASNNYPIAPRQGSGRP